MSGERLRVRGRVRRPDADEVAELARAEHLHLSVEEAAAFSDAIGMAFGALDAIDDLPPLPRPSRPPVTRDPGGPPEPGSDPLCAFIRRCDVRGASDGPLAGVTVGLKDSIAVAGVPLTNGSRTTPFVPGEDAVVVERLLDAGAWIVGKLTMDDFSMAGTGETCAFGVPRNPRDPRRSAGGSSGGTGAAVAGGLVDLGLGVDSGGSGRVPAAFCGAIALKATHGRIPAHGCTHADHTIDAVCPTTTSVELLARVVDAISGHDDRDPLWVRARPEQTSCVATLEHGVEGLRIGLVRETLGEPCQPAVRAGVDRVADALVAAGATVVDVSVPLWRAAGPIRLPLYALSMWAMAQSDGIGWGHLGEVEPERARAFGLVRRAEADDFPPLLKLWLLIGRSCQKQNLVHYLAKAQRVRRALRGQIDAALTQADLLLTPTTPITAPELLDRPATEIELLSRLDARAGVDTSPLNLGGHPALAMPSGLDDDGLPTSAQLVGRHFEDELTLRAARVVERADLLHSQKETT